LGSAFLAGGYSLSSRSLNQVWNCSGRKARLVTQYGA
jgi:hypothetical protein